MKRLILYFPILLLLLSSCNNTNYYSIDDDGETNSTNPVTEEVADDEQNKTDEGTEEEQVEPEEDGNEIDAEQQLIKDLKWIEDNNDDLKNEFSLLRTRDDEPLGPTIVYSLYDDDGYTDEALLGPADQHDRNKLYASFSGDHYLIELGFFSPNTHGIHVTYLSEIEREQRKYILPYYENFYPFMDVEEYGEFFHPNTNWQVTVADVTGNNVPELIVYAYRSEEGLGMVEKIFNVYEYTNDIEEPFRLVSYFTGANMSGWIDQYMYFTAGQEFVHVSYREDRILAFYEDGQWYVNEDDWPENPADVKSFTYDTSLMPVY